MHASTERVFPRNDLDTSAGLLLSDWLYIRLNVSMQSWSLGSARMCPRMSWHVVCDKPMLRVLLGLQQPATHTQQPPATSHQPPATSQPPPSALLLSEPRSKPLASVLSSYFICAMMRVHRVTRRPMANSVLQLHTFAGCWAANSVPSARQHTVQYRLIEERFFSL
jgi:hypothetical protein